MPSLTASILLDTHTPSTPRPAQASSNMFTLLPSEIFDQILSYILPTSGYTPSFHTPITKKRSRPTIAILALSQTSSTIARPALHYFYSTCLFSFSLDLSSADIFHDAPAGAAFELMQRVEIYNNTPALHALHPLIEALMCSRTIEPFIGKSIARKSCDITFAHNNLEAVKGSRFWAAMEQLTGFKEVRVWLWDMQLQRRRPKGWDFEGEARGWAEVWRRELEPWLGRGIVGVDVMGSCALVGIKFFPRASRGRKHHEEGL